MKYYKSRKSTASRVVASVVGFAMALSMAGFAGTAGAATTEELQKQIADLLALVSALQAQLSGVSGGGTTASVCPYTWSTNLKVGSSGADVMSLQKFLNATDGTKLAGTGAGSSGKETSTFGPATKAAVIKFQNMYAADVLTPVGLTAGTGFVGAGTRAKLNMLCASAPTPTPTPTPTPVPPGTPTPVPPPAVGTGLSVSAAATQPANTLAPGSAARIPFTNVVFTAGADGDVTVTSLVIERTGPGADANFDGVLLVGEDGMQIGLSKTLNSDHQATLNEAFVVKAGKSRTLVIAGTMKAIASLNSGELLGLKLVAVNTTATVSGTLPITGATHTVNDKLSIGNVDVAVGPLDQDAATNKDIGGTGVVFNSIKATAGANEDVRFLGIRYNQTGSAGQSDIKNVKVYIDGVAYDTTIDSTAKYYTASFGSGVVVKKGQFKEITVKGDIMDGSGRTIIFDIFKAADIYFKGETYGYGLTPSAPTTAAVSTTSSDFTTGTPFYDEATMTITGGALTVAKSAAVPAQNVAENVSGLDLGAFDIEAKGEIITVAQMDFWIHLSASGANTNPADVTGITLRDKNGAIVAGPVDASNTAGATHGRVRFTDTVTFPVGKNTYYLKAKYGTDFDNNDTVTASTTPSTDFATVRGSVSGNTITASPSSLVTANTMTIKAPDVKITVASVPLAQTIVAGSRFTFANYQLDASNSGDDVQFSQLLLDWEAVAGTPSNLSGCSLFDGTTELTTGSNRVDSSKGTFDNDSGTSDDNIAFVFDKPLVLPKGTIKALALSCSTSATTTTHAYRWGIAAIGSAANTATGVNSGQSMTGVSTGLTQTSSVGQRIGLTTGGTYTVVDDSTPGYSIVTPGTEVTLLKLKFAANNEDIDVQRVAFALVGSTASSSSLDLVGEKVTLWDGTTQVGDATFTSGGVRATSTVLTNFRVPASGSKVLTVKGTIASVNSNAGPLNKSGDLLRVGLFSAISTTAANGGNYGKGVAGGTSIAPTSPADVNPTGVRIMKAYPSLAKIDLSSSERLLQSGSGRVLYKWSVKANGGDVALYKFTVNNSSSTGIAIATTTVTKYSVYAYTDSAFSAPDTSFSSDGLLNANQCYGSANGSNLGGVVGQGYASSTLSLSGVDVEIWMDKTATACSASGGIATTTYIIPSGLTRYFVLKADLAQVETLGSVTQTIDVTLRGDAAYAQGFNTPSVGGTQRASGSSSGVAVSGVNLHNAVVVDGDANNDFIWSPRSTTTSAGLTDIDWTNGYLVPGLPGSDMPFETLTSAN